LFLAGADIKEIASGLANKSPTLRELQAQMEAITKPIVAAIQGVALGGGFELALTCHWRMAASDAKVAAGLGADLLAFNTCASQ
jgi:enoyl-CoA hydratase/carnithine racemase